MASQPHILVIPSWYPTEEDPIVGIFFNEQAQMVREAGIHVGVIYPEIRPLKTLTLPLLLKNYFQKSNHLEDGIPTYRMHGWNVFPKYIKGTMRQWAHVSLNLFERYVREEGMPDLIHAQSALWGGVAAKAIADKYKVPYVLTEHRDNFLHDNILPNHSADSWLDQLMRDVFGQAAQVVAVSQALKKGLARYLPGRSEEIVVIPNFLDMDDFAPALVPKSQEAFNFLTLAHLVKSKNIDLLLKAFQKVLKIDSKVHLNIGGDGPEREALMALAQQLGIGKHVTFLGKLLRPEVKAAFAASHAFVLPSHYETFGIVFIEALAMGLPVISTRCGGPEDIIHPGVGFLVTPNQAEELAERMVYIKNHQALYPVQALRDYAIRSFGKEAIVQRLVDLYRVQIEKGP